MKKSICISILLFSIIFLWAEKPRRYVELGVDADVTIANNYLSINDLLKETIVFDINKIPKTVIKNGFKLNMASEVDVFLNINLGEKIGFGFFTGIDLVGYSNVPGSLFKLLRDGNVNTISTGEFDLSGSVYWDAGVHFTAKMGKLKFSVKPSLFVPIIYMSNPDIKYHFQTTSDGKILIKGNADINIYSPVAINNLLEGDFSSDIINKMLHSSGFDISLNAEYSLLKNLDLGATITHIPLAFAKLKHKMNFNSGEFKIEQTDIINKLLEETIDWDSLVSKDSEKTTYFVGQSKLVARPLKFDIYALFRPLGSNFLVLKPNIGFTLITVYDAPGSFNAGLTAQINIKRLFSLYAGISHEDLLWTNKVGFVFNIRLIELHLQVATQSQDLLKSFTLNGLNAKVGLRIGF